MEGDDTFSDESDSQIDFSDSDNMLNDLVFHFVNIPMLNANDNQQYRKYKTAIFCKKLYKDLNKLDNSVYCNVLTNILRESMNAKSNNTISEGINPIENQRVNETSLLNEISNMSYEENSKHPANLRVTPPVIPIIQKVAMFRVNDPEEQKNTLPYEQHLNKNCNQ